MCWKRDIHCVFLSLPLPDLVDIACSREGVPSTPMQRVCQNRWIIIEDEPNPITMVGINIYVHYPLKVLP